MNKVKFINIDTDDIVGEFEDEGIDQIEMFLNEFKKGNVGFAVLLEGIVTDSKYISHNVIEEVFETVYKVYVEIKSKETIVFLH